MRYSIPIIIASLLITTLAAPGAFAETQSAEYDIPGGPSGNTRGGIAWNPIRCNGPDAVTDGDGLCAVIDPEQDGVFRISVHSNDLLSDCGDCYTDFQVSVTDTLPTNAFYSFCIITEHQDGRGYADTWCGQNPECDDELNPGACDDIPDPTTAGCGSASLTSPVPSGGPTNSANAFVYATYVDETTGGVCVSSKGVLTVDMN